MSKKGQYRKIPEFSLKFLVVITNVYPESTYWVQTLHGWILVTRMGYVFEEVQCRMNIQGSFQKLLRISRGWRQSMKPSMKSFWVRGPGDYMSCTPMMQVLFAIPLWEIYSYLYFTYEEEKNQNSESITSLPQMLQIVNCESGGWKLWSLT